MYSVFYNITRDNIIMLYYKFTFYNIYINILNIL